MALAIYLLEMAVITADSPNKSVSNFDRMILDYLK